MTAITRPRSLRSTRMARWISSVPTRPRLTSHVQGERRDLPRSSATWESKRSRESIPPGSSSCAKARNCDELSQRERAGQWQHPSRPALSLVEQVFHESGTLSIGKESQEG